MQRIAPSLMIAVFLTACSGSNRLMPTSSHQNARQSLPAATSQSASFADGIPDIYATAEGKDLTESDLDKYIDNTVSGHDREIAHTLMRMMPKTMRGDFVYMAPDGRPISNNPRLLRYIKIEKGSGTLPHANNATLAMSSTIRTLSNGYSSQCSPLICAGKLRRKYV